MSTKPKKKKHEHDFKLKGITIYCSCGMTTKLDCAHRWVIEKTSNISFDKVGGSVTQVEVVYHCSKCGSVRHTNQTAGRTIIYH